MSDLVIARQELTPGKIIEFQGEKIEFLGIDKNDYHVYLKFPRRKYAAKNHFFHTNGEDWMSMYATMKTKILLTDVPGLILEENPTEIMPGDLIRIKVMGLSIRGYVDTASNYGHDEQPNWYIEMTSYSTKKPHYWKQEIDGGEVQLLEKGPNHDRQ